MKGCGIRRQAMAVMLWGLILPPVMAGDDGVPGLLKYAQDYQTTTKKPTGHMEPLPGRHASTTSSLAQRKALTQAKTQIATLQAEVARLTEQRNSVEAAPAINTAASAKAALALQAQLAAKTQDAVALTQKISTLETALAAQKNAFAAPMVPRELAVVKQQLTAVQKTLAAQTLAQQQALMAQAEKLKKQYETLQFEKLSSSEKALRDVQAQLKAQEIQLTTRDMQSQQAKQQYLRDVAALKKQQTSALAEKDAALMAQGISEMAKQQQVATLTAQVATLKQALAERAAPNASSPQKTLTLTTAAEKQAYATGVLFGRDVAMARDANVMQGVKLNDVVMLAGLMDAFQGQVKLSEADIDKALTAAESAAAKGHSVVVARERKAGEDYVAAYRQKKGVKQDPSMGFWYLVDYVGDGDALRDDNQLDVVVQERLTDGTVVSDMDITGTVLTQTLKDFPPVFAAALKKVKNHGSIQVVVPPALAYGDKGYPPKVPPGATMIYQLRVEGVNPAATVKSQPTPPTTKSTRAL